MKTPVLIFAALFTFVLCADEPQYYKQKTNTLEDAEKCVRDLIQHIETKEHFNVETFPTPIEAARTGVVLPVYYYAYASNATESISIMLTHTNGVWTVNGYRVLLK